MTVITGLYIGCYHLIIRDRADDDRYYWTAYRMLSFNYFEKHFEIYYI